MPNSFFSQKLFGKYHYFVQITFSFVLFVFKLKKKKSLALYLHFLKIFSLFFFTLLFINLPLHTGQFTISVGSSGKEQAVNAGDIRDEGSIPG